MDNMMDRIWYNEYTDKEMLFLLNYAKTQNKEKAAKAAGYADTTHGWIGDRVLAMTGARQEIDMIRSEMGLNPGELSEEKVIEEFNIIATANIKDFYDDNGEVKDISEMDPEKARAIKEIKRTVNPKNGHVTTVLTMHDKISALQNLSRMGGYYAADNGQTQGDVVVNILAPGGLHKL